MIPFTTRFKRNSRVLKITTLSNELTQNFKTNKLTDELKFTKPPLPHGQFKQLSIFDQFYVRQIAWFNIYPCALKEFNLPFPFVNWIGQATLNNFSTYLGEKIALVLNLAISLYTDKRDEFRHRRARV